MKQISIFFANNFVANVLQRLHANFSYFRLVGSMYLSYFKNETRLRQLKVLHHIVVEIASA